jgi:hypothetical protein
MKYVSLLVVAVAAAALLGCTTPDGTGSCGCLPANCCGWDFYQPCDLIEGRVALECGRPPCKPGMVVSRCYAVSKDEAAAEAPASAEPPVAEFAPPAAAVEGP